MLKLFFEKIPKQFIIIDGLDECDIQQRKLIMTFFTSMVNQCDELEPGKLRVLFVSQEFPDIAKALQTADTLKLTKEHNENDIKSFIRDWSGRIRTKYNITPEQADFIEESTFVRAQGNSRVNPTKFE